MKNFYLWIVAAMVCIGILPAAAQDAEVSNIKFTVNIANAEGVKCSMDGEDIPLHNGANLLEFPNGTNISFTSISPWKISGVTDRNGTAASGFYDGSWFLYVNPEIADQVYTVSVINLDEFRTSQFTVNVDDPSLVNAMVGGYYTSLTLKAGENVIKYDPAVETYLTVTPVNYNIPLYKCTLNGTDVARQGGGFTVMLEPDCVVDITAILPDEDRTVSFSYSEGAEGSIGVEINGAPLSDFNGKSLTLKLGTQMTITGNTYEYNYSQVLVNGEQVAFYGSYTFNVMEDTQVYVDAHPYGSITATIIVNIPELVKLYRGYGNDNPIELKAGENVVELPENNSSVRWDVDAMAILNGVTLNGEPLASYYNSWTLADGDILEFDVTEKVFDKKAIVWVDNVAAPACSFYLQMYSPQDHTAVYTFETGYNLVAFYEAMNPFSLSWFGSSEEDPSIYLKGQVYLNGNRLSPLYEGSASYGFDLNNGDVLKLFMESAPIDCKVTFDIAAGVKASVVKDILTAVENPSAGFDCFAGTQVVVSGENINVTVNGSAVEGEKDEDGVENFTFTVADAATNVAVTAAGGSAVEAINAETDSAVFNMQGVRVGSKADLKSLAPGIYIVAGKKVAVK